MTDHIDRVREQAEREAFDRVDAHLRESADPQPAKFRSGYRVGFVEGAAWAASRPTQDDIADALAGAHDEWCVLLKEFLAGRGDDPGSQYEYKADAIRALLTGGLRSVDQ